MARRTPEKERPDPKAWVLIGKAYLDSSSKIDWARYADALLRINDIYQTAQAGASYAASEGLIRRDEKLHRMSALQKSPVGRLVKALNVLTFYTNQTDARRLLNHAAGREGISANIHLGGELQASELGHRIAEELDRCIQLLKNTRNNAGHDVLLGITITLAEHALDLLLREFGRLMILRPCARCGQIMFPTLANKRFCSEVSEGRDCGHRTANKRFYEKSRAVRGRMTRGESAANAAKVRWAKSGHDRQK